MLIPRSKIVEKIVRNQAGIPFRVSFLVYEEAGQIKARILSARPLEAHPPAGGQPSNEPVLALSCATRRQAIEQVVEEYSAELIPSPFKSLLYFNLNIARGPNAF